ncbi:UNVERIFIED_CONTAM: hypothetical protein FKN15_043232 [Acipenser sinensis]
MGDAAVVCNAVPYRGGEAGQTKTKKKSRQKPLGGKKYDRQGKLPPPAAAAADATALKTGEKVPVKAAQNGDPKPVQTGDAKPLESGTPVKGIATLYEMTSLAAKDAYLQKLGSKVCAAQKLQLRKRPFVPYRGGEAGQTKTKKKSRQKPLGGKKYDRQGKLPPPAAAAADATALKTGEKVPVKPAQNGDPKPVQTGDAKPLESGTPVYKREELQVIADLCVKHGALCISDEVYEWLVYDGAEHVKIATLPGMWEHTITIGSAGKTFSPTGWKVGWAMGPDHLLKHAKTVHQNCVYHCATAAQEAVAHGFQRELDYFGKPESYFLQFPRQLQQKRSCLAQSLLAVGMQPIMPEGGYFLIADISTLKADLQDSSDANQEPDDYRFVKWMIKNKGLATIPVSAFYSAEHKKDFENYVRFCFVKGQEKVDWKKWKAERKEETKKLKEATFLKTLEKQKKKQREEEEEEKRKQLQEEEIKRRGRPYTVSIALPGSVLDNAQSPELRTYLAGQIARACAVFCVDEVVVFDEQGDDTKSVVGEFKGIGKKGEACVQLARILQYLECPQYLRKSFFPKHQDLQFAESRVQKGRVVAPHVPRTESGHYWGYSVRLASCLSKVFTECSFKEGYDLTIGTSERGSRVDSVTLSPFKHALIVFGGLQGLEASVDTDQNLDVTDPSILFDHYLNTCPNQGSRTIRTELYNSAAIKSPGCIHTELKSGSISTV